MLISMPYGPQQSDSSEQQEIAYPMQAIQDPGTGLLLQPNTQPLIHLLSNHKLEHPDL